jgi:hypothetical protein
MFGYLRPDWILHATEMCIVTRRILVPSLHSGAWICRTFLASVFAALLLTQALASGAVAADAGGSISGTVKLGDAATLAGLDEVLVTAYGDRGTIDPVEFTTRTRADGTYSFIGLPRIEYNLKFSSEGRPFANSWWPGTPTPIPTTKFMLGAEPVVRDILLPRAATLSGVVRDSTGAPISNAEVRSSVIGSEGYSSSNGTILTSADGSYVLDRLAAGEIRLSFSAPDSSGEFRGLVLAEGATQQGFDVTLFRTTTLSGTVRCAGCNDSELIRHLEVRFERNVGTAAEPVWEPAENPDGAYTPSAENPFTYRSKYSFDPGTYRVSVVSTGWPRLRDNGAREIDVHEGTNAILDLDLELVTFDSDFSGDALPDVLVRTSSGALLMYMGAGAGAWQGTSTIGSGWSIMNHVFQLYDFSGDGHRDLMARDTAGRLHLYRGDGKGGWLGSSLVGTGWQRMTAIFSPGDFSGDGNIDVLARDGAGDLWLYPGDGKGGWGAVAKVGSGWSMFDRIFAGGDFGGHAQVNVMARTPSGDLYVYPANGLGGWGTPARVGVGWTVFDSVFSPGDFDTDGHADVMGRDRMGNLWLYPGRGGANQWGAPRVVGTGWNGLKFVN